MPGICGYAVCGERPAAGSLQAMADALRVHPWHSQQQWQTADRCAGLGVVSLSADMAHERMAHSPDGAATIVLDGELYNRRELAALAGQAQGESGQSDAALLLRGYLKLGRRFLREVNGSFCAAIWETTGQKLTIVSDRFGTRPLYYRRDAAGLVFGCTIAAVLTAAGGSQKISARGLSQFFTFGHYLRDDTSIEDVFVVPAASVLEYAPATAELTRHVYWSLTERPVDLPRRRQDVLELVRLAFERAVLRRLEPSGGLGLSLSGGLDARSILAVIPPDLSRDALQSLTLGVAGSRDHAAAAELARLAGCRHHNHVLDEAFLRSFPAHLAGLVKLTDGQYLSQAIVMPTLAVYRELGICYLLRGHGGELMHMRKAYSYSLDATGLNIRNDQELHRWLLGKLQTRMLDGVSRPLFAAPYQEGLTELAASSLKEDIAELEAVEPPVQRVWHLFLTQRLRRETPLSMLKFRSVVEPRLPYLDNDLVPLLLAAPPPLKLEEEMQAYIIGRHRPELLRVANTNTGAPVGAGRWQRQLATLRLKVLSKLRVPGYQPYERLGRWLRGELAPLVQSILLSAPTLDRGIYDAEGVRRVVEQHLAGRRNHTYLLMALMIFELGMRGMGEKNNAIASADLFSLQRVACCADD